MSYGTADRPSTWTDRVGTEHPLSAAANLPRRELITMPNEDTPEDTLEDVPDDLTETEGGQGTVLPLRAPFP